MLGMARTAGDDEVRECKEDIYTTLVLVSPASTYAITLVVSGCPQQS